MTSELGAAIHLAPNAHGIMKRLGVFPEEFGSNTMLSVSLIPAVIHPFIRSLIRWILKIEQKD